jgi:two-component sensor histidine kinase
VVRSQLEPFGQIDGVRIAASGPDVPLNSDAAQKIGQALHELATNATKYGALSVPEGWITVRWQLGPDNTGQPCFRLRWCERNGPKVLAPSRRGFGHVVLGRATGQALQGKVNHEFEARGVSWTFKAPLSAVGTLGPNERSVIC